MRKKSQKNTISFLKIGASIFIFFTILIIYKKETAVASETYDWQIDRKAQEKVVEINETVGMPRTVDATQYYVMESFTKHLFNMDSDKVGMCAIGYIDRVDGMDAYKNDIMDSESYSAAVDKINRSGGLEKTCSFYDEENGVARGGLIGVTHMALNAASSGDVPVNLAYFAKQNLQKMPIIKNTAYAQSAEIGYQAPGLGLAYTIWETSRNLAYTMMAIVMLVMGIMIITRRSMSPQAVVTVQSSLPRVVLSLFLITFSYPIGAVMASAISYLVQVVMYFFIGSMMDNGTMVIDLGILNIQKLISSKAIGPGIAQALISGIVILMVLIGLLVASFKALLVYMKIIIMIAFAPLQFAWSALPGQESVISDWFKQMAAHVLAIPAIFFYIGLGVFVYTQPFTNARDLASAFGEADSGNRLYTIFIMPVLVTLILWQALGADKKIAELIGAGGKSRR